MKGIKKDAYKSPVWHIFIVLLFTLGLVSLPLNKLTDIFIQDKTTSSMLAISVLRLVLSGVAVIFIVKYGFFKIFKKTFNIKYYLLVIPALLVAVNNFPIIGVIKNNVTIYAGKDHLALYVFYCFSVGVYEEITFRGLIFPLCYILLKDKKHGLFFSVALSSAFFGLSHLMNLIGGQNFGATALQIGYSFLIGAMCGISMIATGNIYSAILLHFIYDVGGLILDPSLNVARGNQWDSLTITITAILGVIVALIYTVFAFIRADKPVRELFGVVDAEKELNTNDFKQNVDEKI